MFSDLDGHVVDSYDLSIERGGMAGIETSRRAVFVLDDAGPVRHAWDTEEWIYLVPGEDIEAAIAAS
jgi:peroxiredoxin